MISFFVSLGLLVIGYLVYGKFVERVFRPDDRQTPAIAHPDGVDFVPMKTWRVFLVQLLNIAGLGPIFGAILGALWGPAVFFWIALGTILAGGVHDFLSGMISERLGGVSIAEIVGIYLGKTMKAVMRIFSIILLILLGTVFMTGPSQLLAKLTPNSLNVTFWLIVVIIYYVLATLLPIDKLIGKIYPFFGVMLIVMALGIGGGILVQGYQIPEFSFHNLHPSNTPIWPMMFVTVACGAISGFHATQSPMMARCMKSERHGRKVFYGAMVVEGFIALIWAAAGATVYGSTGGLSNALAQMGGQAGVVYDISFQLLGPIGGILAMIGVIVCPVTSGDTAFRSARLSIADWFQINQSKLKKRLLLTIPILGAGTILSQITFDVIWRYTSWANQTLAMMALWAGAVYLYRQNPQKPHFLIAGLPAAFMSAVCSTYILQASEGFGLPIVVSYPAGLVFAAICIILFVKGTVLSKNRYKHPILK